MFHLEGILSTSKNYPYLYIIIKDIYIYIGETERANYYRLGEHLTIGTKGFRDKLIKIDPETESNLNIPIKYLSIGINDYFNNEHTNKFSVKHFLRLIEADLHRELKQNSNKIYYEFKIISDVTKTNPIPNEKLNKLRSTEWYSNEFANIFDKFITFANK
jgi:hypothetical protein